MAIGKARKPLELTTMTRTTFKKLANGQTFHWDEGDIAVEPPKVKISDTLYLDPTANGCKHPIRIQGPIEELKVIPAEGDTVRAG
jgi:hypothetical protein